MNKKLMISADEVAEALGVSMSHAYKIVRLLNKDLEAKGFITVARFYKHGTLIPPKLPLPHRQKSLTFYS